MAGDADMGFNEIIGRIATLEALVLSLLEIEGRRQKEAGQANLDGFVHSLAEAAALRAEASPDLQKQFVNAHAAHILRVLSLRLEPDDRARN